VVCANNHEFMAVRHRKRRRSTEFSAHAMNARGGSLMRVNAEKAVRVHHGPARKNWGVDCRS
jgi:hypothetical protein